MSFIHPTSSPETLLHAHRPPIKAPGDDEEPQPMPVDPDEGPIDPPPEDDQTPGRARVMRRGPAGLACAQIDE